MKERQPLWDKAADQIAIALGRAAFWVLIWYLLGMPNLGDVVAALSAGLHATLDTFQAEGPS